MIHCKLKTRKRTGVRSLMFLTLTLGFLMLSWSGFSQITIHSVNGPLENVFKEIERQTDYVFFYKSDIKNVRVTVDVVDAPLENTLVACFKGIPYNYKIVDKTIVVEKVSRKVREEQSAAIDNPQIEIKGRVTDSTGNPIQSVSVVVKGEQNGTMTNANGDYVIKTRSNNVVLVFSFVGMEETEVPVNGRSRVDLVLATTPQMADDIVVTGFYQKNKTSYTGSASTFTGEQLKSVAPTNVIDALAMVTPGFTITENNNLGSNPNALPDILIRGTTSFANNDQTVNQPLIVRDGTIITLRDLYDMDINDIETITILKDASAAALYGARAANGVIVIERKKLTSGKMRVIYNFTGSTQFPDLNAYHVLNPAQKLEYEQLAGLYSSEDNLEQQTLDSLYNVRLMDINRGVYTDWLKKPARVGISQDHSLRFTGGSGNTRYELNARYGSVQGVMKDDSRKRYGIGFTLEYHMPAGLTFTNRTSLSRTAINYSPYGSFSKFTKMNPYDRVYDEFGQLKKTLSWDMDNPLYEASLSSFSKAMTQNLSNDFDLRWEISQKFIFTSHFNITLEGGNTEIFTSPESGVFKDINDLSLRGSLSMTNNTNTTYSGNAVLSFNQTFPKQTLLTANLGGNFNHMDLKSHQFSGVGFYSDALKSINFASSYPIGGAPGGSQDLNADVAGFLNLNYLFHNKYYFDGVYQVSGSSKFGSNNRYSQFWSAGLGWNLHNESFLQNDWLDIFKIRVSTGFTGKVSFSPYQALTTYRYNIDLNYLNGIGAVPITIGNPDLRWERTMNYNAGFDISLLKRRINLTADFYIRRTNDLVIDRTIAPSAGVTMGKDNLGKIDNRGIEIRLDGWIFQGKKVNWQVGANLMHNENKILKISNALEATNEQNNKVPSVEPLPQFQEGQSTTALMVVPSAGIDPATGREIFIKLNGDYTFDYDPTDKIVVGDLQPKFQGTFFSINTYKNFTLAAYFQFFYNQYIYNTTLATKVEGSDPKNNADERVFNDRWKNPGDVTAFKDIADQSLPRQTTRFAQLENTLSLSRLNLSYEIGREWLDRIGVSKASVGVSANDLFRVSTVKIERGIDYLFSRGFDVSLNVMF